MNLYILVEGRRTESLIYPHWFRHLLPLHNRVRSPDEATGNSYFLISGDGYPQILDRGLPAAIEDIIEYDHFGYLLVCVDADEDSTDERRSDVIARIRDASPALPGHTIARVIVQSRCFESWLLGNKAVLPRHPQAQKLREYYNYYQVRDYCPECMGASDFVTHAAFHYEYLRSVLRERNVSYHKHSPGDVGERYYLSRLVERMNDTNHLVSFRQLIETCQVIRAYSSGYDAPGVYVPL